MTPQNLLQLRTQKCTVGCPVLDRCLAGGIPCNSVTEIVAESGSGKTQICLQLAVSVQLPPSHGGLSASSLYIHSEFPFPLRRLRQLSTSLRLSHPDVFAPSRMTHDPCNNVFVRGVYSADEMFDIMPKIEMFLRVKLKSQFPIRLIVIDSIAALFRSEFENTPLDLRRRSSMFFKISGKLKSLAKNFDLAVVVTNQVVDLIEGCEGVNGVRVGNLGNLWSSGRRVCAALGIAWASCVNSRVFLSRNDEIEGGGVGGGKIMGNKDEDEQRRMKTRRRLSVVFAPHLPESSSCDYVIQREGVFGIETHMA